MKSSLGDKALVWGTILSFGVVAVGLIMWITQIAYVATSTAQAQERFHDEVAKKLDTINDKVDKIADGQARIEGRLSK